jgi:glycerol-3-phosphate acyltransferase PlsX
MPGGAIRIAVDGMGGDHAPQEIVAGTVRALQEEGLEIVLVGREQELRLVLPEGAPANERLFFHHAEEVIPMQARFSEAWAAKDTSISAATRLVKEGKAEALISAGNTSAAVAAALRLLGRLEGVERPAILTVLPAADRSAVALVDSGANVDCKPSHLLEFAKMGYVYMKETLGYEEPSIGLLNIGEESCKGNEVAREAYRLLSESGLPFAGNIEGDRLFSGDVRVVVCDGFVGNVLLKGMEGCSELVLEELMGLMREAVSGGVLAQEAADKMMRTMQRRVHYAGFGGALLLGVDGVCVICHGRSNRAAIESAIRVARRAVGSGFVGKTRLVV